MSETREQVIERMMDAYSSCAYRTNERDHRNGMTAAAAVHEKWVLEQVERAIQEEGDRISWQGFGAETSFAKAVRARLIAQLKREG